MGAFGAEEPAVGRGAEGRVNSEREERGCIGKRKHRKEDA